MSTREELKRKAREKLDAVRGGIIAVRNERNGKTLLAASMNPEALITRYRMQLREGTHFNRALQAEWSEHGEAAFSLKVLDLLPEKAKDDPDELSALEALWLEELQPYGERGYNKAK